LLVSLVVRLLSSSGLGGIDRLGGLLFGVARGAVIAAVLVMLAGVSSLPHEPWWKQSQLIPPFQSLAVWLRGKIPQGLATQINYLKQS
jgi:membrane protein required for colicin V production